MSLAAPAIAWDSELPRYVVVQDEDGATMIEIRAYEPQGSSILQHSLGAIMPDQAGAVNTWMHAPEIPFEQLRADAHMIRYVISELFKPDERRIFDKVRLDRRIHALEVVAGLANDLHREGMLEEVRQALRDRRGALH